MTNRNHLLDELVALYSAIRVYISAEKLFFFSSILSFSARRPPPVIAYTEYPPVPAPPLQRHSTRAITVVFVSVDSPARRSVPLRLSRRYDDDDDVRSFVRGLSFFTAITRPKIIISCFFFFIISRQFVKLYPSVSNRRVFVSKPLTKKKKKNRAPLVGVTHGHGVPACSWCQPANDLTGFE